MRNAHTHRGATYFPELEGFALAIASLADSNVTLSPTRRERTDAQAAEYIAAAVAKRLRKAERARA